MHVTDAPADMPSLFLDGSFGSCSQTYLAHLYHKTISIKEE